MSGADVVLVVLLVVSVTVLVRAIVDEDPSRWHVVRLLVTTALILASAWLIVGGAS